LTTVFCVRCVGDVGEIYQAALGYGKMLRLARIEDAETIATIHVRGWQVAYEGIVPAQYLASLSAQERANLWRRVISEQHSTVLLAITPHGEVGFISFGPSRDKDGKQKAEIYAIYVLPEFWKQGIGRELLDEAERKVEDNNFIAVTLWVLEKNALARRFYEGRGFRLDAARKEETIGGLLLTELRYEKRMFNLKPVGFR
jgi:ribosomal protein S18 acetylase RimI-like enzyme